MVWSGDTTVERSDALTVSSMAGRMVEMTDVLQAADWAEMSVATTAA